MSNPLVLSELTDPLCLTNALGELLFAATQGLLKSGPRQVTCGCSVSCGRGRGALAVEPGQSSALRASGIQGFHWEAPSCSA